MPTVLEQLRAAQRELGITAPEHPEQEVILEPSGIRIASVPALNPRKPETSGISPTVYIREKGLPGGGYIKIFPPTFRSVRDIPEEWKAENWSAPSPWCRMEGHEDHPEFEKNLTALER